MCPEKKPDCVSLGGGVAAAAARTEDVSPGIRRRLEAKGEELIFPDEEASESVTEEE